MLEVGVKAPDFELPDPNGKIHRLSDYTGKKSNIIFPVQSNKRLLEFKKIILKTNITSPIKRNEMLKECLLDTLSYLSEFDLLLDVISYDRYKKAKDNIKLQINI